jgi:MFS family permease
MTMNDQVAWELTRLRERLCSWLGLKPNIVVMFTMILLVGMGEKLWSRFMPRYLELLGAGAWGIAVYGTLHDLLRAIYRYPGGWVTDRCGRRMALTLFAGLALIGYGCYMVSPSWMWILVGAVFVRAWGSLTLPTVFTIIADSLPRGARATGFGLQSMLYRLPIVLAPPLGGVLIATLGTAGGVRLGLGITIVLTLTAILVVQRYYIEHTWSANETTRFGDVWHEMDWKLKHLLVADTMAHWAASLPYVFIVLYSLEVLGFSALQFGLLTSLQMLIAIAIALPAAKLAERCLEKLLILGSLVCYAGFPLVLVHATTLGWIVLAFGLAGLRELGEPARKALIVNLASPQTRGRVVGMYYLLRGLAVFPASLVGGWLWALNPQWPFFAACVLGAAGFLFYLLWGTPVLRPIAGRSLPPTARR